MKKKTSKKKVIKHQQRQVAYQQDDYEKGVIQDKEKLLTNNNVKLFNVDITVINSST